MYELQNESAGGVAVAEAPPPYDVVGPHGAPVVVVLGGISAAHAPTRRPGWWEGVVGPARAIDTTRFRVLGVDWLDGGRARRRAPARASSPPTTQADALVAALDAVGIARVHAVVGASYGGMVALAFAERYPERARAARRDQRGARDAPDEHRAARAAAPRRRARASRPGARTTRSRSPARSP